jgi:hypothetical protein
MSDRARIRENPDFVKDMKNFAILNTNKSAVAKHEHKMAELKRAKQTEEEINNLKSEVSEIKTLLSKILSAVEGEK